MSAVVTALNQADQLMHAGRLAEAKQAMLRAAQRFNREPAVAVKLAQVLLAMEDYATAGFWAEKVLVLAPHLPHGHQIRAHAMMMQGRYPAAIESYRKAAAIDSTNPDMLRNMAFVLHRDRHFAEAINVVEKALAMLPNDPDLMQKKAVALLSLGRVEEAHAVYAAGAAVHPESVPLAEGLAMCTNYLYIHPLESKAAHERFGTLITAQQPSRTPAGPRVRTAGERLRVGLISPDLREHSVGFYAESVMRHVDRERIEVFVYHPHPKVDVATRRMQGVIGADHWRHIDPPYPDSVEAVIRADGLDVLLELSGLTSDHQLAVMARKPAPVIATYIGYPNTTGVPAVDFRIIDSITDPPVDGGAASVSDSLCTERLVRLDPSFLCYRPHDVLPPIRWQPPSAANPRPIVFGSFNNLMKVNDRLLVVWGRLLSRVPESRLALKAFGLGDTEIRADLAARCIAAGIPESRLDLILPPVDASEHLAAYDRIDIGLDTFPYHGTTTTCEAFSMGLPVVTTAGQTHVARVGASLVRNLGTPELVAGDSEDAIRIAADLAADIPRLTEYRRTIRQRLLASCICDTVGYGRRLTEVLMSMAR